MNRISIAPHKGAKWREHLLLVAKQLLLPCGDSLISAKGTRRAQRAGSSPRREWGGLPVGGGCWTEELAEVGSKRRALVQRLRKVGSR